MRECTTHKSTKKLGVASVLFLHTSAALGLRHTVMSCCCWGSKCEDVGARTWEASAQYQRRCEPSNLGTMHHREVVLEGSLLSSLKREWTPFSPDVSATGDVSPPSILPIPSLSIASAEERTKLQLVDQGRHQRQLKALLAEPPAEKAVTVLRGLGGFLPKRDDPRMQVRQCNKAACESSLSSSLEEKEHAGPIGSCKSVIRRPGTDDGGIQPMSGGSRHIELKFRAASAAPRNSLTHGSPALNSARRVDSSGESAELDQIVAPIDMTMLQMSAILARAPYPKGDTPSQLPLPLRRVSGPSSLTPTPPNSKGLLFPNRRDSPSVYDSSVYLGVRAACGSSPAQIPRSNGESSISGCRGHSSLPLVTAIPCDVEDEVKMRYFDACQILKSSLSDDDASMKTFFADFLVLPSNRAIATEELIAVIESAAMALLSNPLLDSKPPNVSDASVFPVITERVPRGRASARLYTNDFSERKGLGRLEKWELGKNKDEGDKQKMSTLSKNQPPVLCGVDGFNPLKVLDSENGFTPTVMTPTVMQALRGFFPFAVAEEKCLLKYASTRDGATLQSLLSKVRTCEHTIISVETVDGFVFGAFCSSPWRVQTAWYGSVEAFLWRLKNPRTLEKGQPSDQVVDNTIEIYPYTGTDELIQYCTNMTIAVGGGTDWANAKAGSPYEGQPTGIGLQIDGDLLGGETSSCMTFANPRLGGWTTQSIEFDIRALEVWSVTP